MDIKTCMAQWLIDNDISHDEHDGCCVGYGSDGGATWDVGESRQTSIVSTPSPRSWDRTFQHGDIVVFKLQSPSFIKKPKLITVLNYHDSEFFTKLEEAINGR
jgi:hypothetical protein